MKTRTDTESNGRKNQEKNFRSNENSSNSGKNTDSKARTQTNANFATIDLSSDHQKQRLLLAFDGMDVEFFHDNDKTPYVTISELGIQLTLPI